MRESVESKAFRVSADLIQTWFSICAIILFPKRKRKGEERVACK